MNNLTVEAPPAVLRATQWVYALHAVGLVLGAFGAATIVGSFLFGWPSLIAVVINYAMRSDARGTWLEPKNRSYPGAARAGGGVGRANWPVILRQM